ncbi:hypothetical protein L228DRAFT_279843 [Xylona heveae TC161]|uniref:SRP9 domain-containing protein n=1 Tax=Xylona heveae (strain CBS 132557 / TC161) TaxID=1328760 RepID=A0A165JV54_XYLHT|nr:hypothetical protein L228DRAFT_279843 [Xylona heveae TC161]KZF26671.1 hypothetical protein L228DRAFT_279843 [Xylona heveae TC161]
MVYLPTSEQWLHQSSLLLQARPTTTRVTTKYSIKPAPISSSTHQAAPGQPAGNKGSLVLKTYDPASGVCLKYRTDKAAEVGRLIALLSRLGKGMSGQHIQEEVAIDAAMTDAPTALDGESGTATPTTTTGATTAGATPAAGQGQGQSQSGGKKKKKGKK